MLAAATVGAPGEMCKHGRYAGLLQCYVLLKIEAPGGRARTMVKAQSRRLH